MWKISAEYIEVLEDIAFENQTPPHENDIAEEDASSIISKLLEDLIEKVCEPEIDKPDTHNRVDKIDKNMKIDGSTRLKFSSGYAPNIQDFFVCFKIFLYSY